MKRLILVAVPIILTLAALIWYFFRDDAIVIGVVAEHTSASSTSSVDSYDAVELAISELNAQGRNYILRRIDLTAMNSPEDLQSELEETGTEVVIGPITSGQFIPIKEILTDSGLPVFLNSVSTNTISDMQDNIFRLTDDITAHIEAIESAIANPLEAQRITIFYTTENRSYSHVFASEAMTCFNKHGLESYMIEVGSHDDKEVQDMLMQSYEGDVFLIVAGPGDAGIIAQLLAKSNPHTPFLFTAWSKDDRLIDYTAHISNSIYLVASPQPLRTDNYDTYCQALEDTHAKTANNFSTYGYEVAYFVDHVLTETKSVKTEDIQAYIHSLQVYEGRFNDFLFDDTGDGGRGYALYTTADDRFQVVIPYLEEVSEDDY